MAKNLLNENAVRRWGKLAQILPLTENFIEERADQFNEEDEALQEDNFDASGAGPHREGTKKNGHDGESGVAKNQGKEAKDTPDGKLEIPGTGYAGDHKLAKKSPEKGSTDGGTQLQGKGKVLEGVLPGEEDEMGGAPPMGAGGPPAGGPPMGEEPPMGGGEMGAGGLEGLVRAIAAAISQETGVEVSVAGGGAEMGDEMGDEMGGDVGGPPAGDMDMGAGPPTDMGGMGGEEEEEEEEEVVESKFNLSEVDDAAFQTEATRRGYSMQEKQQMAQMQEAKRKAALVEQIAKKVAAKLTAKKKK